MDRIKGWMVLAALVVVAASVTIIAYYTTDENKKPVAIAKVNGSSTKQRVDNFFQTKVQGFQEFSRVVWDISESGEAMLIDEESIYSQFGFKTLAEKRELRREYNLAGYKRYKSTCYQLESVKADWSLGYCTSERIPWDEQEA
jgi:hypothetical protein